ncbi:unnamed protein product [Mytilus coruscus]|uniref:Uncharacterized protein n=1 Tax=Mytilus coruscus TaxID=42192 RepID=A0A6J8DFN3_MYTCO|nr:unnamed protein product [Mytilus coruscus]
MSDKRNFFQRSNRYRYFILDLNVVHPTSHVNGTDIDEERHPEKLKSEESKETEWHVYADTTVPSIEIEEREFWEICIQKYLAPLPEDPKRKEVVEQELINLRNRTCLFVYLLNAILVTVMFGLTQVNVFKDSLSIEFEYSGGTIKLVPIAILFTAVFGILLLLQFLCMLYHRCSTLIHICATTEIWESNITHTDKTTSRLADFLISPAISPIVPLPTVYTDKDRPFVNMNRSSADNRVRKFKTLQDVVEANLKKASLHDIKSSLLSRDKQIAQKVMVRWTKFSNDKTEKTKSRFSNVGNDDVLQRGQQTDGQSSGKDTKAKTRSKRNQVAIINSTISSSPEKEEHNSKSYNTNVSDSNV